MTELRAGSRLSSGRYRLERLLGTGGMASVWLGHDTRLDRPVAVKVISDTLAADETYIARFEREARIAAGLSHESLVKVFDYDAGGDRPFIVMEYVPGGTLADRLRYREEAPHVDPEALARDLLGGVAAIHEAGIVHRDVKAGNILFRRDGRAVLTDFGIAHPEDATRLTSTGQVIGTLKYLAPEVVDGKPATPRSDLYSCGIVLRESADPQLPDRLGRLVEMLTRRDPARRPPSAAAALGLLAGEATGPTWALDERTATTRAPAPGFGSSGAGGSGGAAVARRVEVRVSPRRIAAVAAAVAIVALIVVLATSGGDGEAPSTPAPAPRDAPLQEQLDALEEAVGEAGGR